LRAFHKIGSQPTQRRQDKWQQTTGLVRCRHEWCSARLGVPSVDRALKLKAMQLRLVRPGGIRGRHSYVDQNFVESHRRRPKHGCAYEEYQRDTRRDTTPLPAAPVR
jgi:hypothetical protein